MNKLKEENIRRAIWHIKRQQTYFLVIFAKKVPRQFPDQDPKNTGIYRKMILRIVPKSLK
ncbi:hypothetical protein HMPREF3237_08140 [Streptococcus sp. HMSC34B10]|nr:hypothetical protein HMPREF3237_08140 [Streptococcus sp. HMSC34B10]